MSIGGGRTRSTGSYIDGVNNTRGGLGVQNVEMSPPVDSMQEFKVEVNSMGAEYGRSSSGVVTAITKSGTNAWHGSLYHFMRNDAFDAAGWNQDSKPKLRRNNGGGSRFLMSRKQSPLPARNRSFPAIAARLAASAEFGRGRCTLQPVSVVNSSRPTRQEVVLIEGYGARRMTWKG